MWSISLVMADCPLIGRSQGHVSNFYIVDLENFTTASRQPGDIHNSSVVGLFMTLIRQWKRLSRHGWVHMYITHCPTVTVQLHNFDLLSTCCTTSFCTVAWQLARFQLTRCQCNSGASCSVLTFKPCFDSDLKWFVICKPGSRKMVLQIYCYEMITWSQV